MGMTKLMKDLGICIACAVPIFLYCALFMMLA